MYNLKDFLKYYITKMTNYYFYTAAPNQTKKTIPKTDTFIHLMNYNIFFVRNFNHCGGFVVDFDKSRNFSKMNITVSLLYNAIKTNKIQSSSFV